jgi:hypothetical protein
VTTSAELTATGAFSLHGLLPNKDFSTFNNTKVNNDDWARKVDLGISLTQGGGANFPFSVFYYRTEAVINANVPLDIIWVVNRHDGLIRPVGGGLPGEQNKTFLGVKNPLLVLAHASLDFADDSDLSQG